MTIFDERRTRYRLMLDRFEKKPGCHKHWPRIPLCRLKPMGLLTSGTYEHLRDDYVLAQPLARTFKIFGYIPGLTVTHVSTRNTENQPLRLNLEERESWSPMWRKVDEEFENECSKDPSTFGWMKDCLFSCCDGTYRLHTWLLVANHHPDDEKYHPRIECIILDEPNIPELKVVMADRFDMSFRLMRAKSSFDGIKGGWLADAICAKAVLSRKMDYFRKVLGEETVDQYKSQVRKGKRCWYSQDMNLKCAAHVLSIGSGRLSSGQFDQAITWWQNHLSKYTTTVDPDLGEEFLDTVKDLWYAKYFTPYDHRPKGLSVMVDIVKTFASACVSNRFRCKLLKAHFRGDEETKKKYHHPRLNSYPEVRDWLQHWGTWSQVKCIALHLMKGILREDTTFVTSISPALDPNQLDKTLWVEFKKYFKSMRQRVWGVAWVGEEKIPSAPILIGRAKRIVFRYFAHPTIEVRSHHATAVPAFLTSWSYKGSQYSMWTREDLKLNVRTEWEYKNCPWYVEMDCNNRGPLTFGLDHERQAYMSQRLGGRDHDLIDWFQSRVQLRFLQVDRALELPMENSELMQVVEGYMRDKSRVKRKKQVQ